MIYYLYCGLIMSGYSACSSLLGSYMMQYAGATEIDLGFIFMVQPLTLFLRPLICARADRHQSHQQMLAFFCLFTSLCYFPFMIYPFFHHLQGSIDASTQQHVGTNEINAAHMQEQPLHESLRYRLLLLFHLFGSIGWCGVRSLGDALTCNYAKRIGADFARYRKWGSISYGLCNISLGFINQGWLLPSFVPAITVYCASMIALALLVYAWPSQYFEMSSKDYSKAHLRQEYIDSLPSTRQTWRHLGNKLLCCGGAGGGNESGSTPSTHKTTCQVVSVPVCSHGMPHAATQDKLDASGHFEENLTTSSVAPFAGSGDIKKARQKQYEATTGCSAPYLDTSDRQVCTQSGGDDQEKHGEARQQISVRQQAQIFGLLLKRDFRILLYLAVILYGGLVGYSGPNFVFTYINVVCTERGTCNGSQLCGLVISAHCLVETIVYLLVDKFRNSGQNRVLMLEITFLSLAGHYYFYGFAIDHLSPYFFLIECLHGIEYGISLTTSLELGYHFAREVEVLVPELIERQIISERDDKELVKKSLMATLSGCYTMAYEGIGTIIGCLLMGVVAGHFGFNATWLMIGSLSALGFVLMLVGYLIGKCFGIRPEILRIRDRQMAAAAAAATATPASS